jgi:tetratricopeptide (TPR) repeat protein
MWSRSAVLLVVICITWSTSSASGEECSADAKAKALRYYREGDKHFRLGELNEAAESFKQSYAACASPGLLYNLGQTYRTLKDYDKALFFYQQYLSTTAPIDERRNDAQAWIDKVQRLRQEEAASQIAREPKPAPPTSIEKPAEAAPPAQSANEPARAATPTAPPPPGRTLMILGGVAGAVGLGLAGAGIAFGVLAKNAGDDLSRNDLNKAVFDPSKEQAGQRDQILEGVFIGVGAAAVAGGTALILLGHRKNRRAEAPQALLIPQASPRHAALTLHLSF